MVEKIHQYGLLKATKAQLERLLEDAIERRAELEAARYSMGGVGDGMPHVRAGHPDSKLVAGIERLDANAHECEELITLYEETIAKIEKLQLEIELAVAALPLAEAAVARARFIECMPIDAMVKALHQSRSTLYRLLASALDALAQM